MLSKISRQQTVDSRQGKTKKSLPTPYCLLSTKKSTVYCLLSTETGFTLVEVLISLVVLLLVSLALMQTALVGIDSNMINILRDEAVGIAEMEMNVARNTAFDSLTAGTTTTPVRRNIRNIRDFEYSVTREVTGTGDTRQVVITVTWNWKENHYTHKITTIVRR